MFVLICLLLSFTVIVRTEMEGFIVGGSFAEINRYPHSAFLLVNCIEIDKDGNVNKNETFICGSSLLNQWILLTAAHCLHSCSNHSRITVNMGAENRENGIVRKAISYFKHEKYDYSNNSADIGLLKLSKPVNFNARIKRVAIMSNPPYSEQANLAGWGLTNEYTKEYGMNLKEVDQMILSHEYCVVKFGSVPRGTICASSKKLSDFAALGDSGSALIVRGYIQVGLVSYKIPTVANHVIVYTDVGYYYDWIKFHAARLYCKGKQ